MKKTHERKLKILFLNDYLIDKEFQILTDE